jgi:TPR repeat protein
LELHCKRLIISPYAVRVPKGHFNANGGVSDSFLISMYKSLLAIIVITMATPVVGQKIEDLNSRAKILLGKGDYKNAVSLIREGAEAGNSEAQYNYGVCYQQGIEVPQNDSIANIWFLKSAEQGWKDAEFKIAYSYATGRGWLKDGKQAFYWSIKCASQKDPECIFNVINCYAGGLGTDRNVDSMLVWATRLALLEAPEDLQLSGRITSARVNLAVMYKEGQNVEKNIETSYMWYLIYNESKRDFSVLVQQENIDSIKEIEKQLTQTKKDEAKVQAEVQLGHKLNNLGNLYKQDL